MIPGTPTTHVSSGDSTAVASASSSNHNVNTTKSLGGFLTVPSARPLRRASIDSAFSGSDLSELSFDSTEVGSVLSGGLLATPGNTSADVPTPSRWRVKMQLLWIANYGALLVLISQLFGCAMNVATRRLETPGRHGPAMHPFQILFTRQSITVLITTSYALWSKAVPDFPLGPPGKIRMLLIARGLFGFLGVFGLYFSLLYLPISEATVLTFLAPIGSCYAFSLLIPGETFSKQQQIAGFVSIVGVVFIARPVSLFSNHPANPPIPRSEMSLPNNSTLPEVEGLPQPTSSQHLQAVGIAMIGVVGAIGAMTSIRAIGTRAHALLSVNYFSAWCTFVSLIALLAIPSVHFRLPANFEEWGLLSILGFCGFIMQLLLTKGMAYGGPSSSDKLPSSSTQDIEMQTQGVEPQASAPVASIVAVPSPRIANHASQAPIKGSGAKATSMLYTQMLFALAADKLIFGVTPNVWSWVGSGLILLGAIWVAADGSRMKQSDVTAPEELLPTENNLLQKYTNAAHEEGVGLLADVDDLTGEAERNIVSQVGPAAGASSAN